MRPTSFFFAVLVAATCSSVTFAQSPMLVTTSWEVSADNGQSWQAGIVQVPQSQQSVLVRHVVTWGTPGQNDWIRAGSIIPTIRTSGLVGLADTVADIQRREVVWQPVPVTYIGRRPTPNELIVAANDVFPPNSVVSFSTGQPSTSTYFFANPVDVVRYRLHLDGTTGERLITDWINNNSFYRVVSGSVPEPYSPTYVHNSTTLVVVPSPAGLAVLGVASGVLLWRRRGM